MRRGVLPRGPSCRRWEGRLRSSSAGATTALGTTTQSRRPRGPRAPPPPRWQPPRAARRRQSGVVALSGSGSSQLLLASTTAGTSEWLEVLEGGWDPSTSEPTAEGCVVGWKGSRLQLSSTADEDGYIGVQRVGGYPEVDCAVYRAFPALARLMDAESAPEPGFRLSLVEVALPALDDLAEAVKADPREWNDGAEPGAPALSPLQLGTSSAGELLSTMQGTRGICTLQLWNSWESDRYTQQHVFNPFVLRLLEQAMAQPGLKVCLSAAPDQKNPLALSAVVYADKEPWSKWGPHLASFGFQDKIVAHSAYYKMLCGLILGYKKENVKNYVLSTSPPNSLTPAVTAKVQSDLKRLSRKKPKLPWNSAAGGSRGSRRKAAPKQ